MKSSMVLAGACLLALVFTIAECKLNLDIFEKQDIVKRQGDDCGDILDPSTDLGKCFQYLTSRDVDDFCDNDCLEVVKDYSECSGTEIEIETDGKDLECGAAGLGSALLSIITALVVAMAATLN